MKDGESLPLAQTYVKQGYLTWRDIMPSGCGDQISQTCLPVNFVEKERYISSGTLRANLVNGRSIRPVCVYLQSGYSHDTGLQHTSVGIAEQATAQKPVGLVFWNS